MNHPNGTVSQMNSMMRTPKMEATNRRQIQPQQHNQQHPQYVQQQPQQLQRQPINDKSRVPCVSIEEVPNAQYLDTLNNQARFDEEKLPLFLIKLWNIVEDKDIQNIVHWDESGASFHISDPYSFCRNVLPHYFKHNNLNSLIRQLNMYGFRKMTPLNQGGLTRTESDQDHLEFSHPFFIQGHPEHLSNIKRKQSSRVSEDKQVSVQAQHNIEIVMKEVRAMRERQKNMEGKINNMTKENRDLWEQISNMRQQHTRQQHVVKKLFQFLVSMVQPNIAKRVTKRGVLAIDDFPPNGQSSSKRPRTEGPQPNGLNSNNLCEMLETLQRELQDGSSMRRFSHDNGPLIADVTDELGNSPVGSSSRQNFSANDHFNTLDVNTGMPFYSEDSRDTSPMPMVSTPNSLNSNRQQQQQQQQSYDYEQAPNQAPHYMGSGALTTANVTTGQVKKQMPKDQNTPLQSDPVYNNRKQPKRSSYKSPPAEFVPNTTVTTYQPNGSVVQHAPQFQNQLTYKPSPSVQNQLVQRNPPPQRVDNENLNLNSTSYDRQETYSPTLVMSPSLDRQISQELQDYVTGMDFSIDTFREMLKTTDWDHFDDHDMSGSDYAKYGEGTSGGNQLALENTVDDDEYHPFSTDLKKTNGDQKGAQVPSGQNAHDSELNDLNVFDSFPSIPDQDHLDQFPNGQQLLDSPPSSPSRF